MPEEGETEPIVGGALTPLEEQRVVAWAFVLVTVTFVLFALALKLAEVSGAFWTVAVVFWTVAAVLVPTPAGQDGSMLPSDFNFRIVNL